MSTDAVSEQAASKPTAAEDFDRVALAQQFREDAGALGLSGNDADSYVQKAMRDARAEWRASRSRESVELALKQKELEAQS